MGKIVAPLGELLYQRKKMTVQNNSNQYLPGTIQSPSSLTITGITNSYPAVVTISVDPITESNTFQVGQLVRMTVPIVYRMYQINGVTIKIIEVSGSTLSLDVDSTNFDTFVTPSSPIDQPASLSPSGSRNLQFNNTTNKVPFQSLNNIGN